MSAASFSAFPATVYAEAARVESNDGAYHHAADLLLVAADKACEEENFDAARVYRQRANIERAAAFGIVLK